MQKLLFEYPLKRRKEINSRIKRTRTYRLEYFKYDFYAFALYYFSTNNFTTGIKDFHKEIYKFCVSDKNSIIIGFRESGKTSIVALIYIIYCIATEREKFILFMAFDLESAKDKVLNVSNSLRINRKLKADYGLLFDDGKVGNQKEKLNEQKTMSKFVSTNGIRVEAVSLKNMKRGKLFLNEDGEIIRPSLLIADDLDIEESVKNVEIINQNENKLNSGVLKSIRGKAIFLGNIIIDDGVIQRLEETYKGYWNTKRIALIEDGKIVWEERYVWKEKEALRINNEKYNGEKVVQSIEMLSIDEGTFNSDFLNKPNLEIGNPIFNKGKLDEVEILTPKRTFKINIDGEIAVIDIFSDDFEMDIINYVYAGGDLGGGDGGDYTDLTFLDKNGKLFLRFSNNQFNYKKLIKLLIVLYDKFKIRFFKNSLGIENNYLGKAFFDEMEDLRKGNKFVKAMQRVVYLGRVKDGGKLKRSTKLGFNTNQGSKEKLKTDLQGAVNRLLFQFDKKSKKEFYAWEKQEKNGKIIYTNNTTLSKHDDGVISGGIAFQMFLQNNPKYLW